MSATGVLPMREAAATLWQRAEATQKRSDEALRAACAAKNPADRAFYLNEAEHHQQTSEEVAVLARHRTMEERAK